MMQSFIYELMCKRKGYGLYCNQPPGGNKQLLASISWLPWKVSYFVFPDLQKKFASTYSVVNATRLPDLIYDYVKNKYKNMPRH